MSGFFGGDEKQETSSTQTTTIERSPAININAKTGGNGSLSLTNTDGQVSAKTTVDPNVRARIREGLNNSRSSISRLEGTIAELRSNTNAFINARVNPLEEAVENRIAQKGRDFAQRNIFGSLASSEMDSARLIGEREIGNARAIATQEALTSALQAEGVLDQVNQNVFDAASRLLQTDLAELGIDLEAIQLSQSSRLPISETSSGTQETTVDDGGSILGDIVTNGS